MMKQRSRLFRKKLAAKLARNPFDLAYRLCHGKGLEIGAMSSPYYFGASCEMSYADIHDARKLQQIVSSIPIEGLYRGQYVHVTYELKPPRYGLEMIPDGAFDFAYSSHSLEHTPNPIWALTEQLRVVRRGGVVYAVIPNKETTYDRMRAPTPVETLIGKFERMEFEHTIDEATDVVLNSLGHPLYDANRHRASDYAREILANREGIHHFHVFDPQNTLQMLLYVVGVSAGSIEYFSAAEGGSIHFAIRKRA